MSEDRVNPIVVIKIFLAAGFLSLLLNCVERPDEPSAQAAQICATASQASHASQASRDVYADAIDEIHWRESRNGEDSRCRLTGQAGEMGEFQVREIFIQDVKRIGGNAIDPYDLESCRMGIRTWLKHYAPRVGAETPDQMCELYRRGPTGYREAQK